MCFVQLHAASGRGELILIDGGFCNWHLRKDGQLTIAEIISIVPGTGTKMLETLKQVKGATRIVAKCPEQLESNKWYEKKGFVKVATEKTRSTNKNVFVWCYQLQTDTGFGFRS